MTALDGRFVAVLQAELTVRKPGFSVDGTDWPSPTVEVAVFAENVASLMLSTDESPLALCRVDLMPAPSSLKYKPEDLLAADGAGMTLMAKTLVHPEIECFNTTDPDPDLLIDFGHEVDLSTLTIMSSERCMHQAADGPMHACMHAYSACTTV